MHPTFKISLIALIMPTLILAGDLFFSEYIEGSSNNKALEIYNGTGNNVDLSAYSINQSYNGTGWGTVGSAFNLPLSGILANGNVYVICASTASQEILNVANLKITYGEGEGQKVVFFNGNDAVGLFKNGVLIDVIGVPTEDPGSSKGWKVAETANATYDHTIVRKNSVATGNTNWAASAGTSADDSEWEVYPKDKFDYLGFHGTGPKPNIPPIANAGFDKYDRLSSKVILDGSASKDQDGSIVSYLWAQFTGNPVTINDSNQPIANFISPAEEGNFSFILTVTDDSSVTKSDTVNIRIAELNIIISEYLEGTSYNKYLEIYNSSQSEIDLNAEGWELKSSTNGANNFESAIKSWGSHKLLAAGGVIVLGNSSVATYPNCDTLSGNISFTGNDAIALFKEGFLVDLVGVPTSKEDIIKDIDLRRKNSIINPNPVFSLDEWDQFEHTDVSNLGIHPTNLNAPLVSDITVSPEFVTSADEITVSATITPVVGSIASATIYYGATGSLINSVEMWNETGDTWMGNIPTQTGNSIIEFYIYCKDDQSPANSGKSATQSLIIANSTPETIANIHKNVETLNGQMITIRGIVTIGAGVLANDYTSAYIQDTSGRGLNLYEYGKLYSDITRGDELMVVGYVEKYFTTVEVNNFIYKKISSGNELPPAQVVTVAGANSSNWEGTLIEFSGMVAKRETSGTATDISVSAGTDTIIARIPDATGIDVASIALGNSYKFKGVGNQFQGTYQTLIGYAEDIVPLTAIKESKTNALTFKLNPAYPNPFNPATTISWQLDKNGAYEVVVFNVLGQKIDVIASGYATAGSYSKVWNAAKFPSGVYFVQLQAGNRVRTQKMLYLK